MTTLPRYTPHLIPVKVISGLSGRSASLGSILLRPAAVGASSRLFGSSYILVMSRHYDRYVVSGFLPRWNTIQNIYASAAPALSAVGKQRASSVTGNIGESIAAIVARRKLGSTLNDIEPINAGRMKSPDFRIRIQPKLPPTFALVTGIRPSAVKFNFWPTESKAAATEGGADRAAKNAISQLGAYWFFRSVHEPSVVGFGLVVCFLYRGTVDSPDREIRIHVFSPTNQAALKRQIAKNRRHSDDLQTFLGELQRTESVVRRCLRDV